MRITAIPQSLNFGNKDCSAVIYSIQLLNRPWPCCACGRRDFPFPEQEDILGPARCTDASPRDLPCPSTWVQSRGPAAGLPADPSARDHRGKDSAVGSAWRLRLGIHACSAPSRSENGPVFVQSGLGEEVALLSTAPLIPNSWAHWGHLVTNGVTRLSNEDKISSCET